MLCVLFLFVSFKVLAISPDDIMVFEIIPEEAVAEQWVNLSPKTDRGSGVGVHPKHVGDLKGGGTFFNVSSNPSRAVDTP